MDVPDSAAGTLPPLPPEYISGVQRLHEVTSADGALPAGLKALFMAAAAAAKRDRELAGRYLERARSLGIDSRQLLGAAIALRTSRGTGAYVCFVEASGNAPPAEQASGEVRPTVAGALAHFREYFGTVPAYVQVLADYHEAGLVAYATLRKAVLHGNPLGPRDAELILCTINAIDYVPRFVEVHVSGALRAGATPSEVIEAIMCAVPIAGVPAWIAGGTGVVDALAAATP